MEAKSIKDFAAEKKFTQIAPKVRVNANGYPYITFINAENVAENIYFSKKASEGKGKDMPVTKEMLQGLQVAETLNEQGETRIKLISNSERVDLLDLL